MLCDKLHKSYGRLTGGCLSISLSLSLYLSFSLYLSLFLYLSISITLSLHYRRDYQRALVLDPLCLPARINLAYTQQVSGKLMQAWKHFTMVIEVKPSEWR